MTDINHEIAELAQNNANEHTSLRQADAIERTLRTEGDNALRNTITVIDNSITNTNSRLTTESQLLHQKLAEINNFSAELQQALSSLGVENTTEIMQLSSSLETRISSIYAELFKHAAKDVELENLVNIRVNEWVTTYSSLLNSVNTYVGLLSTITADQVDITVDATDINGGAWTILSECRLWDLEIIDMILNLKVTTEAKIENDIEESVRGLPTTSEVVTNAINALITSDPFKKMKNDLSLFGDELTSFSEGLIQEALTRTQNIANLSQGTIQLITSRFDELNQMISNETNQRIAELTAQGSIYSNLILSNNNALFDFVELTKTQLTTQISDSIDILTGIVNKAASAEALQLLNTRIVEIEGLLTVQSTSVTLLTSRLDSTDTSLGLVTTRLAQAESSLQTTVTELSSVTSSLQSLNSEYNDNKSSVNTRLNTLASENVSQSSRLTQLESSFTGLANSTAASISSLVNTVANNESATSLLTQQLSSRLTTLENSTATADALKNYYTKAEADNVIASSNNALSAMLNGVITQNKNSSDASISNINNELIATNNQINSLYTTVNSKANNADLTATNNAVSLLSTRVTNAENGLTSQSSQITSLSNSFTGFQNATSNSITGLNNSISNINGSITTLSSQYTSLNNSVNANSAAITNEQTARTTQFGSLTSSVNTLTSRLNIRPNLCPGFEAWNLLNGFVLSEEADWGLTLNCVATGANLVYSPLIPIIEGRTYVLSYDSRRFAGSGLLYCDVGFFNASIQFIGDSTQNARSDNHDFSTDNINRDINAFQFVVPNGAVFAHVRFVCENITGTNNFLGVRQIKLEYGSLPATLFTQEATVRNEILARTAGQQANAASITQLATVVNNNRAAFDSQVTLRSDQYTSLVNANTTLSNTVNGHTTTLGIYSSVINGLEGKYSVGIDNNGVFSGFVLTSTTNNNGMVRSEFAVNANVFYIGNPSANKKPFLVSTGNTVVNGITYPAGVYMDTTFIADATIGNAKISSLDAGKINAGTINADRIAAQSITGAKIAANTITTDKIAANAITADKISAANLSLISNKLGSFVNGQSNAQRVEFSDNGMRIYNSNNILVVEIGIFN